MTVRGVVYKGGDPDWARAVEEEMSDLRTLILNLTTQLSNIQRG